MIRKEGIIDLATLLAMMGILGFTLKVFIDRIMEMMVAFAWPF